MKDYQNYMFDLYGTLIDIHTDETAPRTWKKFGKWLDSMALSHPAYYKMRDDFFARDTADRKKALSEGRFEVPEIDVVPIFGDLLEQYGNGRLPEDFLHQTGYAFRCASRQYIRLFPGVTEYLEKLRAEGKKLYILSNAQACYTWPEILMFRLNELTDDQLMSSDFLCMKPDPRFFNAMIEKHHLDRSGIVMIGDSASSDVAGAVKSGLDYIHLAGENRAEVFYSFTGNRFK